MEIVSSWKRRWSAGAALAVIYVAMAAATWGKWPDAWVDFGHELYAAWQVSEGKAFGRDVLLVATGPLSPHVNALLFKTFGAQLRVLVAFNLLILALLTWLLYSLASAISDRVTAAIACAVFLTVFAFGQYLGVANYNYVTPYSHGATHGLALALLALWLLHRYDVRRSPRSPATAGLAVGLVFLTKPEIFVAAAASTCVWWCVALRQLGDTRRVVRALLAFGCAVLLPTAILVVWLSAQMPATEVWRFIATPWLLLETPLARMPLYSAGMGLDAPVRSMSKLVLWAGAGMVIVACGLAAEQAARRWRIPALTAGLGLFLVALLGLGLLVPVERWLPSARSLPLAVLVGAAGYCLRIRRGPADPTRPGSELLGLALSVFAFVLLGKMLLNARLVHYGFVLAMPALVLVVVWMWWSVPRYLRARGMEGMAFRGLAAACIVLVSVVHVGMALSTYRTKRIRVGSAGNAFVSDERGELVNQAVRMIEQRGAPRDTLTVLPEGVMINFLTGRTTPSPYLSYTPEMIAGFGEEAMLAPLRRSPPDLILLVSRDTPEYGARTFGKDYGLTIMRWVKERYAEVALAGASPLEPGGLGVVLLERRGGPEATSTRPRR